MRREMAATLRLAWPVILAELGWVLMGIVDTIAVGPLGPAALGAVGTGSSMFLAVMVLGIGTLFALDTYVSQAFGAGRVAECHRWLVAGAWLAGVMSVGLVLLGLGLVAVLPHAGLHPEVLPILQAYLRTLLWSAPPLLFFTVCRRYLQSMHVVRPIVLAVVAANVVNAVGNWMFIYGHLGAPALGPVGSAYATLGSRLVMMATLVFVVLLREARTPSGLHDVPWTPDVSRMWSLLRLGAPAAGQIALEVGVFAAAAGLAGRISPVALAANQIVLNIAGFVFMVPYGLGSAAAVRVGHAVGRRDEAGARRGGWAALLLALMAAGVFASAFLILPEPLLRLFTRDPSVLTVGTTLLALCAVFQPFDGFQTVATGALRGVGDTRTPMICNLVGHWLVGLPIAYVLCFGRGWGVIGLWTGLSLSLVTIGAVLVLVWHRRSTDTTRMIAAVEHGGGAA